MNRKRRWSDKELQNAVLVSKSIREVIQRLGLIPAGGNYVQIQTRIRELGLNTNTLVGSGWRRGKTYPFIPRITLEKLLVSGSTFQSFKLKKRLFREGLKQERCELCGWAEKSEDGRIPVELDHINGDKGDNRIENLRILCPNCHSLQSTHRGKNQRRRGGEIGRRATLKMS
jgi:hypothetical protein